MKAVLINGARPLQGINQNGQLLEPPPSSRQGFGRIDLSNSVPLGDAGWALIALDRPNQQLVSACVEVMGSDQQLRGTLAWTDLAASVVSDGSLVGDIDLTSTHIAKQSLEVRQIWPLAGLEDRVNVAEKIVWSSPDITICKTDVPFGGKIPARL
jgi:hypothetical protein